MSTAPLEPLHIVQIAPKVAPGAGIQSVAWELQREFEARGHRVENLTYAQLKARPGRFHRSALRRKIAMIGSLFALYTGGTRRARAALANRPQAVSLNHSSVLAGDVHVTHVIAIAALRARGWFLLRLLRNPLQPLTYLFERARYRGRTHRRVVALTSTEADELRRSFGRVRAPVTVIPNGVDLERFHPPTAAQRRAARERWGLDDDDRVALFVGHELRWKGLPTALRALIQAPTVLLLVVGGDSRSIPAMRQLSEKYGVAERVHFAGVFEDVAALYAASDMFVFPTLCEPYGLVITEALASGLPVLATAQGCAPDLLVDGVNGFLCDGPTAFAARMEEIAADSSDRWRDACRGSVAHLGWSGIADRYLALLAQVRAERGDSPSAPRATGPNDDGPAGA